MTAKTGNTEERKEVRLFSTLKQKENNSSSNDGDRRTTKEFFGTLFASKQAFWVWVFPECPLSPQEFKVN